MSTTNKPASKLFLEVINHECPDEEVGKVLRRCLTATTTNRAGVTEPDFKTQLSAAIFITGQRYGLPVRREEVLQVNVDADSAVGLEERLRHSPALRSLLRAALDRAESTVIQAPGDMG